MHPSIYLCIWPHHEAGTDSPLASHITSRSPATQPTTESHCCFLVLPKMSEKPATAVHPLNRSSKGGPSTILQQDALQKNCRNAKAHRILYILPLWQWLWQELQVAAPKVFRSSRISNLEQFLQQRVFHLCRIRCEPTHSIQSKFSHPCCVR